MKKKKKKAPTKPEKPEKAHVTARRKHQTELKALEERILIEKDQPPPKLFSELPISQRTIDGLTANSWVELTEIQRASILPGLAGRDVLGEAKTGSGKTKDTNE